jgi:hypothetical protein
MMLLILYLLMLFVIYVAFCRETVTQKAQLKEERGLGRRRKRGKYKQEE